MSEVLLEARELVKGFRSGESYLLALQQSDLLVRNGRHRGRFRL